MDLKRTESAEGGVPADAWISAVVKVAVILIIGIVILNGVVTGANVTAIQSGPFGSLYTSTVSNINSGYSLAALMVLAIGAAGVLHFLGFM